MKTIRVVLDTNVIVSAHLNASGYERHVLDLALSKKLLVIVSEPILAEYAGVLLRPKFGINPRMIAQSMRRVRAAARIVKPKRQLRVASDPADNWFIECADTGGADYLVTGNKRHFPKQWRQTLVVNARELIEYVIADLRR